MTKSRDFEEDKLILRDYLSINRSKLTNEGTLLAYIQTGLMLFISGLSLVKLFSTANVLVFMGYFLMPLSVLVIVLGVIRFKKTHKVITESYKMKKVY